MRGEETGAVTAVEAADPRTGLAEARVVGRDGEVAHDVQHVAAADRVPGDHRDHGLGKPTDLHLQVEHVEPADAVVVAVAVVAAHALIAAGTERLGPLARKDDHADRRVVAGELERVAQLEQGARAERVADFRTADGDLGDAVGGLVADVGEAVGGLGLPLRSGSDVRFGCHDGLLRLREIVGAFTPTVRLTPPFHSRRKQVIDPRKRTVRVPAPANSGAVASNAHASRSARVAPFSAASTKLLIVSW